MGSQNQMTTEFKKSRTAVFISHRLPGLRQCDKVVSRNERVEDLLKNSKRVRNVLTSDNTLLGYKVALSVLVLRGCLHGETPIERLSIFAET